MDQKLNKRYRFYELCLMGLLLLQVGCKDDEVTTSGSELRALLNTPIYSYQFPPEQDRLFVGTYFDRSGGVTSEVYKVELDDFSLTKLMDTEGGIFDGFAVSDNERYVVVSTYLQFSTGFEYRLELHDLVSDTKETLVTNSENSLFAYAISPDNKYVLYGEYLNGSNKLMRHELATGENTKLSGEENAVFTQIHPVNSWLLLWTYEEFYFIDWQGNQMSDPVAGFTPGGITSDGNRMLCKKNDAIYVLDINTSETSQVLTLDAALSPISFSNDGHSILFITDKDHLTEEGDRTYKYEMYLMDASGEHMRRLTTNKYSEFPIGFLSQGNKILFTTNKDDQKGLYTLSFN